MLATFFGLRPAKRPPRRFKILSRRPPDGSKIPKTPHNTSKTPKNASKMPQDASKPAPDPSRPQFWTIFDRFFVHFWLIVGWFLINFLLIFHYMSRLKIQAFQHQKTKNSTRWRVRCSAARWILESSGLILKKPKSRKTFKNRMILINFEVEAN